MDFLKEIFQTGHYSTELLSALDREREASNVIFIARVLEWENFQRFIISNALA